MRDGDAFRVPAVGHSAVSTRSLPGGPPYKEAIEGHEGARRGERRPYEIDGPMVAVTIVYGKVGDIPIAQR
ncbi:hypothetical protein J7I44_06575 [Frateuria sp. MAH-13]|uniref:Uncharacterized protein n=1 Tax=Frateuria flava TaxID=2821489 RepID=A0ABS4DLP6_9GAMM|nr:hypothetical protein [Frateuria flava]MBP1473956.1 hypothetical protein [Frateuria flava]